MDKQPSRSAPLPLPKVQKTTEVAELPEDFVPLRLVLVPSKLSVELTRPDMLVGRHSDADLPLPLADVSRRHCRFVFVQSRWHIFDLKSLNGVYVNNKRIEQATLTSGDRIRIGGFLFEVQIAGVTCKAKKPETMPASVPEIAPTLNEVPPMPGVPLKQRRAS